MFISPVHLRQVYLSTGLTKWWIDSSSWRKARYDNQRHLERLAGCLKDSSCGSGESTVVLLASPRFGGFLDLHFLPGMREVQK